MSKNKDINNDILDSYIDEEKILNENNEKNTDECSHPKESKISVSCNLKVDFDTENKMIYLSPGKAEYFTVNVPRCCGDVTIKYKGCIQDNGIRGNLGVYHIVESGIIVETYCKLDPRKKDILKFTAIDECTEDCYDFVVVFSSKPYCCCY